MEVATVAVLLAWVDRANNGRLALAALVGVAGAYLL